MKWSSDPFAEQSMKDFGASWEIEKVDVSSIDENASKQNNARVSTAPIQDELVEDYALAMERGDVFPLIVLFKKGKGYIILGGNHRFQALRLLNESSIDAYIVKSDDP